MELVINVRYFLIQYYRMRYLNDIIVSKVRKMEFKLINSNEFKEFSKAYNNSTFLQSFNMSKYQQLIGRVVYFPAIVEGNNIICASLIIGIKSKLGYYYSCPRGFLIDYYNNDVLEQYVTELKKFLKSKKGISLNIEPNILYKERDINGKVVESGFNNQEVIDNLVKNGFVQSELTLESNPHKQIRWSFALNYENCNEEEVFNSFKNNTKNLIKKAVKYKVKTRELTYEEIKIFKDISDEAGNRKGFDNRSLDYYNKMYECFNSDGEIKYIVSYVILDEYIESLNSEKSEYITKLANLKQVQSSEGKRKEYIISIDSLEKKIKQAYEYKSKYGEEITISGAMFMLYNKTITYLFSGSYEEFMPFNGQYLIQWYMIKYGVNNGFTKHDFYGITGDLNKSNPKYGVYEFKKGFNGQVEEYIGDFTLVLNPLLYKIYKIL